MFTCGPASVKAIKNGQLYLGYDARFLFAEVNGDRIHWTIDADGNMEAIAEEKSIVGRFLSTKAVNTISREDVTNCYRYAEGEWIRNVAEQTICTFPTLIILHLY